MTGSEIAEQWSKLFVLKSFDGEQRVVFTPGSRGTEGRSILSGVIHSLRVGEDFAYEQVQNALEAIAENGLEDVENAPWDYYVADMYTSDLAGWLASNINHVRYLDDVIGSDVRDGSQALMQAQGIAMEEIWQAVIEAIQDEVDEFDLFSEEE